jgi:hypothetical protein
LLTLGEDTIRTRTIEITEKSVKPVVAVHSELVRSCRDSVGFRRFPRAYSEPPALAKRLNRGSHHGLSRSVPNHQLSLCGIRPL